MTLPDLAALNSSASFPIPAPCFGAKSGPPLVAKVHGTSKEYFTNSDVTNDVVTLHYKTDLYIQNLSIL